MKNVIDDLGSDVMNLKEKLGTILRYAFERRESFVFNSTKHDYFYHHYNMTILNERFIEVPIVKEYLNDYLGENILEVGNVMSHYFDVKKEFSPNYTIVDKYEISPNVLNEDIITFKPQKPFDLILSVSTIEHVGKDETPADPKKANYAIKKIRSMLAPGGTFVCTIPIGYNKNLEKSIDGLFDDIYCLKRISKDNKWIECKLKDLITIEYGTPFNAANAIIVGVIHNTKGL